MISIPNDSFDKLKQNLLKLNIKKRKKRVTEGRVHLTQYLAHALPLATQRLMFAPIYRSCIACQGGARALCAQLSPANFTTLNILGELYGTLGFTKLWSLSRLHILPGVIFPGVMMIGKGVSNYQVYHHHSNGYFGRGYLYTASLCNAAHLISYPFDVAFGRFASTMATEVSLRDYFRKIYMHHGIERLYSGYSLCVASTCIHLLIALPINHHLQSKLKERISYQIDSSPIATSTIRPLEPRELKPIEMFPWNIIFGSVSAFLAKTMTYPIDTIRIRYQQESWKQKGRLKWKHLVDSIKDSFRGGICRLYAGYPVRSALFIPEFLVYGMVHYAVIKSAC